MTLLSHISLRLSKEGYCRGKIKIDINWNWLGAILSDYNEQRTSPAIPQAIMSLEEETLVVEQDRTFIPRGAPVHK